MKINMMLRKKSVVFLVFFLYYIGHVSSQFTVNGTLFYNVTGGFYLSGTNPRDIVDPKSTPHKEIARNLSCAFRQIFEKVTSLKFIHNVTVFKVFLWPSVGTVENNAGFNLSFVMLAKNQFKTSEAYVHNAEDFVEFFFRMTMNDLESNTVLFGGFEMNKNNILVTRIPKNEVNMTIDILNQYMSFITKTKLINDPKDARTKNEVDDVITIISYIGIALSVAGLLITLASICYFRRLRTFRGNQILVHICATIMVGMLLSVVSFTYKGKKKTCSAIAIFLHYFILAALFWMCVEAHNLYRDLVKVFNTHILSSKAFFLRACLFAYAIPAAIVGVVVSIDRDIYGQRNGVCWMTSLAFVISFLTPVLLLVFINFLFFVLIMREIVQVSQRDAHTIKPSLRAAISLSVLLGFCWAFAAIATFSSHDFFQYAFVLTSSFQGFYIFLFHGVGKKELRDSWKSLGIFNWRMYTASSAESQGRGKTESTQDVLQAGTAKMPGRRDVVIEPPQHGGPTSSPRITPRLEIAGSAQSWVKRDSCNTLLSIDEMINEEKCTKGSESTRHINVGDVERSGESLEQSNEKSKDSASTVTFHL